MQRYRLQDFVLLRGDEAPVACRLPCSAQGVLVQTGLLPDPTVGCCQDIVTAAVAGGCTFVCRVSAPASWLCGAPVQLTLRDVRESCEVSLNGHMLGRLCRRYEVGVYDLTPFVREGDNELRLHFPPRSTDGEIYFVNDGSCRPSTFDPAVGFAEVALLRAPCITQVRARPQLRDGRGYIHIKADVHGADEKTKVVATLSARNGKMYYTGLPRGEGELYVADPDVWDVGGEDGAHLYRLSLTLYYEDEPFDEQTSYIGFSDIRTEGEAAHGRRDMLVYQNGERVLLKGCAYTAASLYPRAEDAEREESLVREFVQAGFNLLRVPSNAPPPTDTLLSLCDRFGVFVWYELPPVPEGEAARTLYLDAMRRQLCRIGAHVCLLFVSTEAAHMKEALTTLMQDTAPAAVFLVCDEVARTDTCAILADLSEGVDLDRYLICRPPHALPTYPTVRAFAGQDGNLYGRTVEYHTLQSDLPTVFLKAAAAYPYPADIEAAVYVTDRALTDAQVTHITEARFSTVAAAVMLPSFFDLYPITSSSLIDGYGRRRAAFYGVSRALAPLVLSLRRQGYRITFRVHNDRKVAYDGRLHYTLADRENHILQQTDVPAHIDAQGVCDVETVDLSTRVFRHEREYYLSAYLDDGRAISSHSVCLFTEAKYFDYAPPVLQAKLTGTDGSFELRLRASAFVQGVYVTFDRVDITAQDNLVDLSAELPVKLHIRAPAGMTAEQVYAAMRITSVNHVRHGSSPLPMYANDII